MNSSIQYISPFMFAATILTVLVVAAFIRLISKSRSRLKTIHQLQQENYDDNNVKKLFKQKVRHYYMIEERRNREKLKRQISKRIMLAQTYQFHKLHHSDITHIIRRTLLNFRYRFFTNLRLALIRKSRGKKDNSSYLTHMQQTAIKEMMIAMGLKNYKNKSQHSSRTTNHKWAAHKTQIKEMNVELGRKNLDKPPEIRKAAISAGYYTDGSLKKVIDDS